MRFKVNSWHTKKHNEFATGVSWSGANELLSVGDDKTIWQWTVDGEPQAQLMEVDCCCTDLLWYPSMQGSKGSDVFVIGCTDGTFKLISKVGRIEKVVPAHQGAVTALKWSNDGTSLATCGEDGLVKSWSRTGMFRAQLAQASGTIYTLCWSPESDSMLFSDGKHLVIRPLQPSSKQTKWKAHDAPVLKADWNPVNNLIVSGGEDCKYRVWDAYGRQLYASAAVEFSISSVAWAPNGRYFAVGSFNMLRLCDKTGWSHSREQPNCGSIFNLSWTADSTQVAGASGSGAVLFGHLLDREVSCSPLEVKQTEPTSLSVTNVLEDTQEELQFKDRVTEMSLTANHLVVVTATQCVIFSTTNWSTPHILELRGTVSLIMQAPAHFAMVDTANGLQVLNFDGRLISQPRFQGMQPELLSTASVGYSSDTLAIIDQGDTKVVRLFDPLTAKQLGSVQHTIDVEVVALSQSKGMRRLALVDRNRDLYITPVQGASELYKLHIMVDSVRWSDADNSLAAVADGQVYVWYYPEVVYMDRDLLPLTLSKQQPNDLGKTAEIVDFRTTRVQIRRSDGAVMTFCVSPYPSILEKYCIAAEWEPALRLCRYVKSNELWACLAAMAVCGKELHTAEVAYAAIDQVDKLLYMCHIKELPTVEAREAELLLFRRRKAEALQVLVQAGWIYRAIKMCIRLHQWQQAFELARKHTQHIDTVLYYRQKYLAQVGRPETIEKLHEAATQLGEINEEQVRAKIEAEKERERERGGAKAA